MEWKQIVFLICIGVIIGSQAREYFLLRELRRKGKKKIGKWTYIAKNY